MDSKVDMEKKWKRPDSVLFPSVWRRCEGLKKMPDGKIPKFRIQDVTPDMHDEIIQFMAVHFIKDEPICQCVKLAEDPDSTKKFLESCRKYLKQNMALVAFLEDDDGNCTKCIVGTNITGITYKTDHHTADMSKEEVRKALNQDILQYACQLVNVFEHYGVEEYMSGYGFSVDPVYRGQGLGLEILKARFDLGRAVGLEVTMTVFSGPASQTLAHRVGMEVLAEVMYEVFKDEDGKPMYPNIKSKSFKVMASRIK